MVKKITKEREDFSMRLRGDLRKRLNEIKKKDTKMNLRASTEECLEKYLPVIEARYGIAAPKS